MDIEKEKLVKIYIEEETEQLAELESGLLQLERAPHDKELINTIFRAAHTIKGSSGSMAVTLGGKIFQDIANFVHEAEELLDCMRKDKLLPDKELIDILLEAADLMRGMLHAVASNDAFDFSRCAYVNGRLRELKLGSPVERGAAANTGEARPEKKSAAVTNASSATIRIDTQKLDNLINLVGEMVIIHSMLQQALSGNGNGASARSDAVMSQLLRIGRDIQETSMSLRMLPVGEVFHRFTRLVRELSESKNKNADLALAGEETELDKGVLEKITDPLVHLIRNAIDHGIEQAEERIALGKPARGTVHLSAYPMGDSVYIHIRDDGRGLEKEKILAKALSQGLIPGDAGVSDEQIYDLIFLPGFSTAETVTEVSGRGVGMDVVKKNIESLNGRVTLRTEPGKGTAVTIKLPLTLAIIDGLTVHVGSEVFVIPVSSVLESLRPRKDDVKTLNEKGEVVFVRNEYIPLLRLHELLDITPRTLDPSEAVVVVVACEGEMRGLLVDDLIGEQQVVIKKLGGAVSSNVRDIAGGTILGDGRVALVLDVPGVLSMSANA